MREYFILQTEKLLSLNIFLLLGLRENCARMPDLIGPMWTLTPDLTIRIDICGSFQKQFVLSPLWSKRVRLVKAVSNQVPAIKAITGTELQSQHEHTLSNDTPKIKRKK